MTAESLEYNRVTSYEIEEASSILVDIPMQNGSMTHESTRLEFAYMEENSSGSNGSIACYKSVSIMLEKFIQTCQHYDSDSKHVYT